MAVVEALSSEARARAVVAEYDESFRKSGPPSFLHRSLFMVAILGIVAAEVCSVTYIVYINFTRKGKEIPVWYQCVPRRRVECRVPRVTRSAPPLASVPLCPAASDPAISRACPDCAMFASRDVGAEACPSRLQLDDAGAVSYRVPAHFFDGTLPYKPALFYPDSRTHGGAVDVPCRRSAFL